MKNKNVIFCLGLYLLMASIANTLHAQTNVFSKLYKPGTALYVSTASGSMLREKPDPAGAKIEALPYGKELIVLANPGPVVPFTTNNIKGTWVKVKAGDKEGFVFDGYLSRFHAIQLTTKDTFEDLGTYLKANFKTQSETNKLPDSTIVDYTKIIFQNGITYESKQYEGGLTEIINLPVSVYTFQEVYLLAKANFSDVMNGSKCVYKEDYTECGSEEYQSNIVIQKEGKYYIVTHTFAD